MYARTHTRTQTHTQSVGSIDPVTFVVLLQDDAVTHNKTLRQRRQVKVHWGHTHTHAHMHTHRHEEAAHCCARLQKQAGGCLSVILMRPSGPLVTEGGSGMKGRMKPDGGE